MRLGAGSGGERKAAANLCMRHGDWYLQAGWSWLDADGFPLPDGFIDYKANPTDTGAHGRRGSPPSRLGRGRRGRTWIRAHPVAVLITRIQCIDG